MTQINMHLETMTIDQLLAEENIRINVLEKAVTAQSAAATGRLAGRIQQERLSTANQRAKASAEAGQALAEIREEIRRRRG